MVRLNLLRTVCQNAFNLKKDGPSRNFRRGRTPLLGLLDFCVSRPLRIGLTALRKSLFRSIPETDAASLDGRWLRR
jgi:hypothetical protein